jgi:hypothetical protein
MSLGGRAGWGWWRPPEAETEEEAEPLDARAQSRLDRIREARDRRYRGDQTTRERIRERERLREQSNPIPRQLIRTRVSSLILPSVRASPAAVAPPRVESNHHQHTDHRYTDPSISKLLKPKLKRSPVPLKETETGGCVVCMENQRQVTLIPCGHYCLCSLCGTDMLVKATSSVECPLCKVKVAGWVETYE